jgi:hypothetical protein
MNICKKCNHPIATSEAHEWAIDGASHLVCPLCPSDDRIRELEAHIKDMNAEGAEALAKAGAVVEDLKAELAEWKRDQQKKFDLAVHALQEDCDRITAMKTDILKGQLTAANAEIERLKNKNGCVLSGPGRGDCEHYLGVPKTFDETTTDCYGRPKGWCEICWCHYQIERLKSRKITSIDEIPLVQELRAEIKQANEVIARLEAELQKPK